MPPPNPQACYDLRAIVLSSTFDILAEPSGQAGWRDVSSAHTHICLRALLKHVFVIWGPGGLNTDHDCPSVRSQLWSKLHTRFNATAASQMIIRSIVYRPPSDHITSHPAAFICILVPCTIKLSDYYILKRLRYMCPLTTSYICNVM